MSFVFRWMIDRDHQQCAVIDAEAFGEGWSPDSFSTWRKDRTHLAWVADDGDGHVMGYILYTLYPQAFVIERFAVGRRWLRAGVASGMLRRLQQKVSGHTKRSNIIAFVDEKQLPAQLCFRHCGFRAAMPIVTGNFEFGDTCYRFVWRGLRDAPANRIARFLGRVAE